MQLQLDIAQRRDATQVVYEILERYESLVNQNASIRLDRDLPNCAAIRSWFENNEEESCRRKNSVVTSPSEWRNSTKHAQRLDAIPEDVVRVEDENFLRDDTRSRSILNQLEYQMARLGDHEDATA